MSNRGDKVSSRKHPPFKFRPILTNLGRRGRVASKQYARFYGNYITKTGKKKRFSFMVKVDPAKKRSAQYVLMKMVCKRIKGNKIPPVPNGFTFDDFGDLLVVQDWMHVRNVRRYEAGMLYER